MSRGQAARVLRLCLRAGTALAVSTVLSRRALRRKKPPTLRSRAQEGKRGLSPPPYPVQATRAARSSTDRVAFPEREAYRAATPSTARTTVIDFGSSSNF